MMPPRALGIVLLLLPVAAHAQRDLAGAGRIRVALERLQNTGRLLHIAAHPDDENTALLALSARGWNYRTAYLSLTRGEGGQNLIGSEQGDGMGVIRTQELLAARRIDGAEQFFSRAIDFGFTKTAEETLRKWDREKVLGDAVYVIRKFQPDVVVLRFSGTPRDGHGQHQASALLGKEAFAAAADPSRFPEQLAYVKPWQATRLLFNVLSFSPAMEKEAEAMAGKITVDLGVYDPVLGYSFGEIAGMSRSQHRSQAMGWREDKGAMRNFFTVLAGTPASKDLFEGIDTSWERIPGGTGAASLLRQAAQQFDDRSPEKIVPLLLQARAEMRKLNSPAISGKLVEVEEAIALCAGLFLDASAARPLAVAGKPVQVRFSAVNRSPVKVSLDQVEAGGVSIPWNTALERGRVVTEAADISMPSLPTQPYWLAKPRLETMYAIDDVRLLGEPDGPVAMSARFKLRIAGETIEYSRPVQHRYIDRIYGELTRPLVAVPPVLVRIGEKTILFPNTESRDVPVQVTAMEAALRGTVSLQVPPGWSVTPMSREFSLAAASEQTTITFRLTPPANPQTGLLRATVVIGGVSHSLSMTSIEYPHIPPQAVFAPAEAKLVRAGVSVLSKRVGYVMGAGDEVPRALEQMGCHVSMLGPDALAQEDLSRYDAIVTGVRAFNTRPDLRANARRLFEYAGSGGTVIVQYNVMEGGFMGGDPRILENVGPYPIKISQQRVTVEDVPVEFNATHRLMTAPNRITAADFEGWVQERGLYFSSEWDPKYESLFSMHDPGEQALRGGTLYTRYGKGAYVFTPMSWFRQLPAGVPGAYRIFANFLSAAKAAE